jgi:hypothetical protein
MSPITYPSAVGSSNKANADHEILVHLENDDTYGYYVEMENATGLVVGDTVRYSCPEIGDQKRLTVTFEADSPYSTDGSRTVIHGGTVHQLVRAGLHIQADCRVLIAESTKPLQSILDNRDVINGRPLPAPPAYGGIHDVKPPTG